MLRLLLLLSLSGLASGYCSSYGTNTAYQICRTNEYADGIYYSIIFLVAIVSIWCIGTFVVLIYMAVLINRLVGHFTRPAVPTMIYRPMAPGVPGQQVTLPPGQQAMMAPGQTPIQSAQLMTQPIATLQPPPQLPRAPSPLPAQTQVTRH